MKKKLLLVFAFIAVFVIGGTGSTFAQGMHHHHHSMHHHGHSHHHHHSMHHHM